MSKAKSIRRTINGVPYVVTPNANGFRVTCVETRQDRFYRSYQVLCKGNVPLSCSCPHCSHHKAWCKHLREVEKILEEQGKVKVKGFAEPNPSMLYTLTNSHGWKVVYQVVSEKTVSITRKYRGNLVDRLNYNTDEAREHYKATLNQGFTKEKELV